MLSSARVGLAHVSIRFSFVLAVVFGVTVVSSSFPVRLLRYDWLYDFANTVRTSTPLAILSIGFLILAMSLSPERVFWSRYTRSVGRLGWWVALGYFLLIPLQGAAGYFEVQRVDFRTRSELAATSEILERIVQADSPDQLKTVILSVPSLAQQLSVQPAALNNFEDAKKILVRNGKANLEKVRAAVKQKIDSGYRRFWLLLMQNSLVLAFYGYAFASLASRWGEFRPQPPADEVP